MGDFADQLVYVHAGFGGAAVPFEEAWDLQRHVHARRVANELPDCCLLLEHEPVYTAGKRTAVSDRPAGDPGAPVYDIDRGGKITWHGPGQLVAYPIIGLRAQIDVLAYVRALEEAMIGVCAEFGVRAVRVDGRSGAWIPGVPGDPARPDRKVGAIGARVARRVTMHGLALNCDCDLSWFDRIVPCGIRDAGVTSLTTETGIPVTVSDVTPLLERHLAAALGYRAWQRLHSTAPLLLSPGGATPRTPRGMPDGGAKISDMLSSPGRATPGTPRGAPGEGARIPGAQAPPEGTSASAHATAS